MKEAEQKKREHMNYAFNTTPLIKITNRLLLSCVKNKTCWNLPHWKRQRCRSSWIYSKRTKLKKTQNLRLSSCFLVLIKIKQPNWQKQKFTALTSRPLYMVQVVWCCKQTSKFYERVTKLVIVCYYSLIICWNNKCRSITFIKLILACHLKRNLSSSLLNIKNPLKTCYMYFLLVHYPVYKSSPSMLLNQAVLEW